MLLLALLQEVFTDLLANLFKRLWRRGLAFSQLEQVKSERRREHGAELADFHRECNKFEFLRQFATFEKAQVDVVLRFVGVELRQLIEVIPGQQLPADVAQCLVCRLALLAAGGSFEDVRGADFFESLVAVDVLLVIRT
jgi:hypothetical protein